MSFYTALTGLNGSSVDISATSNNIANVGTTGFKRSKMSLVIFLHVTVAERLIINCSGTILKGITAVYPG